MRTQRIEHLMLASTKQGKIEKTVMEGLQTIASGTRVSKYKYHFLVTFLRIPENSNIQVQ